MFCPRQLPECSAFDVNPIMGLSKKIRIGKDPAYGEFRQQQLAQARTDAKLEEFTFRIGMRRKNAMPGRRWCPLWPNRLKGAAEGLYIDYRLVNDVILFRTAADRDEVLALAEKLWRDALRKRGFESR